VYIYIYYIYTYIHIYKHIHIHISTYPHKLNSSFVIEILQSQLYSDFTWSSYNTHGSSAFFQHTHGNTHCNTRCNTHCNSALYLTLHGQKAAESRLLQSQRYSDFTRSPPCELYSNSTCSSWKAPSFQLTLHLF